MFMLKNGGQTARKLKEQRIMSIPEMDMNPEIARKLLEVGEEFRIEGPFFSYEEIKMGNVNHTYKVNYIRDDGTGMAKIKSFLV